MEEWACVIWRLLLSILATELQRYWTITFCSNSEGTDILGENLRFRLTIMIQNTTSIIEISYKLLDDLRIEPWNIRGIGLIFDLKPVNNYAKEISAMWAKRNERRKQMIAEEEKKLKSDSEESVYVESDSRNGFQIDFFVVIWSVLRKPSWSGSDELMTEDEDQGLEGLFRLVPSLKKNLDDIGNGSLAAWTDNFLPYWRRNCIIDFFEPSKSFATERARWCYKSQCSKWLNTTDFTSVARWVWKSRFDRFLVSANTVSTYWAWCESRSGFGCHLAVMTEVH